MNIIKNPNQILFPNCFQKYYAWILAKYMIVLHTNLFIFICFRSFSAMNLATKFASNIKRKMSDQHIVQFQGRTRTRSAFLTTAASPTATASYQSNLKTRSGVLYVYSRSRRTFQVRKYEYMHMVLEKFLNPFCFACTLSLLFYHK